MGAHGPHLDRSNPIEPHANGGNRANHQAVRAYVQPTSHPNRAGDHEHRGAQQLSPHPEAAGALRDAKQQPGEGA